MKHSVRICTKKLQRVVAAGIILLTDQSTFSFWKKCHN